MSDLRPEPGLAVCFQHRFGRSRPGGFFNRSNPAAGVRLPHRNRLVDFRTGRRAGAGDCPADGELSGQSGRSWPIRWRVYGTNKC